MKYLVHVFCHQFTVIAAVIARLECLSASGGTIRHDMSVEDYRTLGQQKDFECVIRVGVKPLGRSEIMFRGNGVLIAPQWVLTAGHVATAAPLKRLRFQFGDEVYGAQRVVPHPTFPSGQVSAENKVQVTATGADLALIELDRPISHVRPATRYRGEDELGRTLTIVGDGAVADGKNGLMAPLSFERRGFNNICDGVGATLGELNLSNRVLVFDFDDPNRPAGNHLGNALPLNLEGTISKGDSGGGWFIMDDGQWKLVAVTSGRLPPSGDIDTGEAEFDLYYGGIGVGMRIGTANHWIDSVVDH